MISESSKKKLEELAGEVSLREGCKLYDLEFTSVKGSRILRIYVEGIEAPVTVEQCAEISRGLSLLLDVDDIIPGGNYSLEVSSPGVERPLREPWHFEKAVGEKIKVKTSDYISPLNRSLKKEEKVKGVTGKLKEVNESKIIIETEKDQWVVPFDVVHKANVVFEFGIAKNINKRGK